jgi:hypothetical protein
LSCTDPHEFSKGTNLVVALHQQFILKIFPPMLRHQFESERAALARFHGRLSISVPQIVFEGERSGWPYLVITRMKGVNGDSPSTPCTSGEELLMASNAENKNFCSSALSRQGLRFPVGAERAGREATHASGQEPKSERLRGAVGSIGETGMPVQAGSVGRRSVATQPD